MLVSVRLAAMASSSILQAGALCPLHSHSHFKQPPPLLNSSPIPTNLTHSHFFRTNYVVTLTRSSPNASLLPLIRAQSSSDYFPDSKFYKVEAILRPWRVQNVSSALLKMGIRGVTVSDVCGFGAQGGSTERHGGMSLYWHRSSGWSPITVPNYEQRSVIDKIIEEGRTGEIGDGKIFLVPVADVIRVRTGERGEKAEMMTGGRYDMSVAT